MKTEGILFSLVGIEGSLNCLARTLGMMVKTCQAIAKSDREEALRCGITFRKFDDKCVSTLCTVIRDNHVCFRSTENEDRN